MSKHPQQPTVVDDFGKPRFIPNQIVRDLAKHVGVPTVEALKASGYEEDDIGQFQQQLGVSCEEYAREVGDVVVVLQGPYPPPTLSPRQSPPPPKVYSPVGDVAIHKIQGYLTHRAGDQTLIYMMAFSDEVGVVPVLLTVKDAPDGTQYDWEETGVHLRLADEKLNESSLHGDIDEPYWDSSDESDPKTYLAIRSLDWSRPFRIETTQEELFNR